MATIIREKENTSRSIGGGASSRASKPSRNPSRGPSSSGSSSSSSKPDKDLGQSISSGGSSSGSSSGGSSGGSYGGGYGSYNPNKPQGSKYDGPYGDTPIRPLDDYYYQKEQQYKSMYEEARKRALAGDKSAITDMRNANDWMNQVRNDYGLAANSAEGDLSWVKNQIGYYDEGKFIPSGGGGGGGGYGSGGGFGYGSGGWGYGGGYQISGPNDLSEYLQQMYEAQKNAALAGIKSAYDKNLGAIEQSAVGVDARYQDARNQTAGASELAKRNFAEFAAASGLNSGAGGQAELSRNVALQNNLNTLNQEEANFFSNIEIQKAQAESDYNNAIAQAEANNDFAQAQALYQEKVRVQEALRQQELQQMQLAMQQYQFDQQLAMQQQQLAMQQQQYKDSVLSANQENLANYGSAFLQQGIMPSDEMLAAMGITSNDAQSFINSMTRVSTEPTLTYSQMMDAINGGHLTPNVLSAYEYYMGTGYQPGQQQQAKTYTTNAGSGSGNIRSASTSGGNASGASWSGQSMSQPASATPSTSNQWAGIDTNSVTALGYGPISRERLESLVDSGEVISYQDPSTGLIVFKKATQRPVLGLF